MLRRLAIVFLAIGLLPIIASCGGGNDTSATARLPTAEPTQQTMRLQTKYLDLEYRVISVSRMAVYRVGGYRYEHPLVRVELELVSMVERSQTVSPTDFVMWSSSVSDCCDLLQEISYKMNGGRPVKLTVEQPRNTIYLAFKLPTTTDVFIAPYGKSGGLPVPINLG